MAACGIGAEEEMDELTPLHDYAQHALERDTVSGPALTILTEACSACIRTRYQVTEACQGCLSRLCMLNCPKNAVSIINGKAHIDVDKCINCGRCQQVCPYKAIIKIPIPCEEACPTGAISKDEYGKEQIDFDKCIYCGKCLQACPFGAIAERSQILQVLKLLTGDTHTTALIAPAIVGQFPGTLEQLHQALRELGFDTMLEVATGAEMTAAEEAREFKERMAEGDPLMTTSCCPAYVETVRKHLPELTQYVSQTASPMEYAADLAKQTFPGTKTVFIGPCIAKRMEAASSSTVDYVLTFEELGALLVARDIDVEQCEALSLDTPADSDGRGFPVSGGVAQAITPALDDETELHVHEVNGLDARQIRQMQRQWPTRCPGNFVEVMACEGGCVAGPGVLSPPKKAARKVEQLCRL